MIINTDLIYPIGAIYLSVSATNPATLFGGKWEQIKDRFLLAAGDTYAIGTTGGEATHKLTVAEMPSHSHGIYGAKSGNTWPISNAGNDWQLTTKSWNTNMLTNTGGNQAHNNMPPYIVVYVWKRVA